MKPVFIILFPYATLFQGALPLHLLFFAYTCLSKYNRMMSPGLLVMC